MSQQINTSISHLFSQINERIVGQEHVTKAMVIALLTGGHILLEGLPGTAKTRAVKTLAELLQLGFGRVQFTPDLLPSDVTGTQMYHQEESKLTFQPGPIFNPIVLADEINRAPAKVQAALLEAMAEGTVTVGGESRVLPELFMVLATQNPIGQEGTYPLPEAQMDRFIMKIDVGYPDANAELEIIELVRNEELEPIDSSQSDKLHGNKSESKPLAFYEALDSITLGREEVKHVYTSDPIKRYIVDLVMATRFPQLYPNSSLNSWIDVGVSPRASIALDKCSRAHAWIEGRDYVTPDDVRSVAIAVLSHRITLSFDAVSESISPAKVVDELLLHVPLT